MELRHFRYFVALAEELHFGRAAARLHIVQPALSKQISGLEGELGVRLFERTKRQVRLTEPGEVFLEESRRVLGDVEAAVESVRRAARGEIGRLGIGFIGPATYSILPDMLKAYRERFPGVALDLHEWTTAEQVKRLHEGSIQVGFVRLPVDDDGLVLETVLGEPVVVVLPGDHPLAGLESVPLEALSKEPFVLIPRRREPGLHDHYVSLCRKAGFSPRVVQEANRINTIVGLVAAGMGVSFAPASVRRLQRPGVAYRPLRDPSPALEMAVARLRRDPPPVLRSFLEVVEEFSSGGALPAAGEPPRSAPASPHA